MSSKDLLEKYEYLTGEDLGHRPSVFEKTKFEYFPLGMSLSKSIKKDNVKNFANRESDFDYDSKHSFYRFYKEYNEFEVMPLDSKYNKMKKFTNLLTIFKNLKPRNPKTLLKKKRIRKILMSFTKSIAMITKMILAMMMGQMRVRTKNLTTNSLSC